MQLPLPLPELAQIASTLPGPEDRVYVNRSLRLDQIDWVGFDMDYTLAIYHQEEMDRLSIEATCNKLCERGYPDTLLGMKYRTNFPIRGLLVDRKLGNVIKMDRFKYVKRAYHGMRELTREERRQAYHTRRLRPASSRYHWVDSLYALSEVTVYSAAIEALEATGESVDPDQLFADVRECIDLSHRDGSILDAILADLPRYVYRDPALAQTLHALRSSGKRLFLLTNSYPAYTERMMTYLLEGPGATSYRSWRNYFELVVTAAGKPSFFAGDTPVMKVANLDDPPERWVPLEGKVTRGSTYASGSFATLQALLDTSPDRVLYVGDHIYGDVLKATKTTAWRTMLILQEMDVELAANAESQHSIARLDGLLEIRDQLLDDLRDHQAEARRLQRKKENEGGLEAAYEASRVRHKRAVDRLRQRLKVIEAEYDQLEAGVDHRFHPYWGSLFKAGPEVSAFGHQVENYASLYTARVSNLRHYAPLHYFHSPRDRMPHELV
ncbi:MAG: 5'-nucleotidase [Sandaracinus sp.]|nr:5'-nucleotidase [Sandaracinus sp.]